MSGMKMSAQDQAIVKEVRAEIEALMENGEQAHVTDESLYSKLYHKCRDDLGLSEEESIFLAGVFSSRPAEQVA